MARRDHRYDIGVLVGRAREAAQDTQTQAASKCGVKSQTRWNFIEKNIAFPTPTEMDEIISVYFPNDRAEMTRTYKIAAQQWNRRGAPAVTQSYNEPTQPSRIGRS